MHLNGFTFPLHTKQNQSNIVDKSFLGVVNFIGEAAQTLPLLAHTIAKVSGIREQVNNHWTRHTNKFCIC